MFALSILGLLPDASYPQPFPRPYVEGFQALQAGDLPRAISLMREAVGAMPDSAPIHSDLGTAYYRQGDFEQAVREYTAATKLDPANPVYHNNLATALIRRNRPEEALKSVRAALKSRPGWQDALMNRGVVLLMLGRYAEAETVLRRVTDPGLRILCNLALSQYRQSKWDEALKTVEQSLRLPQKEDWRKVLLAFRDQIRSAKPASGRERTGFSFALKGGYVDRRLSSDYFDTTRSIQAFEADDFNTFSVEGEGDYRFSRYFSLSGSIGYFDGEETGLNKTTTTGVLLKGSVAFDVLYGLLTLKGHYPVGRFDFYGGAGVGWYNAKRKVRLANLVPEVAKKAREDRTFSNVGFHGVGGVAVRLGSGFFLLGEIRGFRARFDSDVNAKDDTLDLGPLMYLGGVGYRF
ncbi:MAG: tetratricopeptide repeat protein [Nitrospinota bacterium]